MLSWGKMIIFDPARQATTIFFLDMVGSTAWFNANDSNEVGIVIPAEGPSF
jgi:hypothetical protein